jgi:hypothetical protein
MDPLGRANQLLGSYNADKKCKDHKFTILILRNLLKHAPNASGRDNVCDEITRCVNGTGQADPAQLRQVADMYKYALLIPIECFVLFTLVSASLTTCFKVRSRGGGKTPDASSHTSRASVDIGEEINETLLEKAKRDPGKVKKLVSGTFVICCYTQRVRRFCAETIIDV